VNNQNSPFGFLLFFAPAIVCILFGLDLAEWAMHPTTRYAPPEYLVSLVSATITASLTFFVQREYVKSLEQTVVDHQVKLEEKDKEIQAIVQDKAKSKDAPAASD
jgi:hypothetical protein